MQRQLMKWWLVVSVQREGERERERALEQRLGRDPGDVYSLLYLLYTPPTEGKSPPRAPRVPPRLWTAK